MTSQPVLPEEENTAQGVNRWAQPVEKIKVSHVPDGAVNLNVEGRQMTSPLQGFGQMWQKTFKVRLPGIQATPAEVMAVWKANFPKFQPEENRFHAPAAGIQPGQVMFIDATVPAMPGTPSILPVASGVMILYADDVSFTVMTPEGFPEAGWNTFSVAEEDGCIVAQAQSMCRPMDPIYEFAFRFLGSSSQQDQVWTHVLQSLAAHYGITAEVTLSKTCMDPKIQWKQAKNVWHNAALRTMVYKLATPARWMWKAIQPSR